MLKRGKNLLSMSIDICKFLILWTYDFNPLCVIFNIIRRGTLLFKNFKYWCYSKSLILKTYDFNPLPLPFNNNTRTIIILSFFIKEIGLSLGECFFVFYLLI